MKKIIHLLIIVISIATIMSGLAQVIAPSLVLGVIGAEITASTNHFFAIIGMFMALFGGLMLHTIYSAESSKVAVLWSALQKLGAFVAVGLGVMSGLFSALAWGVALFDLFSGLLFLYYLKSIRSRENA